MRSAREVELDVSGVDLTRPDGTSTALGVGGGAGVQVVVLMRHRH